MWTQFASFVMALVPVLVALGVGCGGEVSPLGTQPDAGPAPEPTTAVDSGTPQADATLANLTLSRGTLTPAFSPTVTSYTADVVWKPREPFTITPTASNAAVSITVKGVPVASGQPSAPITLVNGANPIDVVATTPTGGKTVYTVVVSTTATFTSTATLQGYIKASNTHADDHFGHAIALSGDTLVVGSKNESSAAVGINGNQNDSSALQAGAVYVYTRTNGVWSQQAYIKASNTRAGSHFGISVALSGDTLAVAAMDESSGATTIGGDQADTSAPKSGAVYVFTRSGTTWSQQAYIKASNTRANAAFGWSVALDKDTLVVGAGQESSAATTIGGDQTDTSAPNAGAAYVFTRSGTTWTQQAYLKASNTRAGAVFGASAAVSGDTVAIGAIGESSKAKGINGDQTDTSAPNAGAVYVFTRSGTTWTQQAYVKASNTSTDSNVLGGFGLALGLSGDTLAVGVLNEGSNATGINNNQNDTSAPNAGAVYVFTRAGATWAQQAYVKASNTRQSANFGNALSLSGDLLVVGSPNESSKATGVDGDQSDTSATAAGAVYVFQRVGGTWSQAAYVKPTNTKPSFAFGYSVAVSGSTIAVGAPLESSKATGIGGDQADTSATSAGAAYVYQ